MFLTVISLLDFTPALDAGAPRLRHAFGSPRGLLVAQGLHEVRGVLDAAHAAAQQGRWCVGFVRYEAAPAFDAALVAHPADGPLAWFAVYDAPLPWPEGTDAAAAAAPAQVDWADRHDRARFDAALAQIQQAIAAGAAINDPRFRLVHRAFGEIAEAAHEAGIGHAQPPLRLTPGAVCRLCLQDLPGIMEQTHLPLGRRSSVGFLPWRHDRPCCLRPDPQEFQAEI